MLTEEASRERRWGSYPALRKVLEDKRIPDHYYGPSSFSDNMFDKIGRLLEIGILAYEQKGAIREYAQSVGKEQMYSDLHDLQSGLEYASAVFRELSEKVEKLRML